MQATKSPFTNLWHTQVPITKPTRIEHTPNNLYHYTTNAADRVAFYHACCFSPSLSTWTAAIDRGHFATWPNLTTTLIRQFPPTSTAMHKGHLDQSRKNQKSTKQKDTTTNHVPAKPTTSSPPEDSSTPTPPFDTDIRSHAIFADCETITGKIASDLTGRFVSPSNSGNNYLLIIYDYDSNYIAAEPMQSRSATDHINAFKTTQRSPIVQ